MPHRVKPEELSQLRFERVWVREACFVDSEDATKAPSQDELRSIGINLEVKAEGIESGDRAYVTVRAILEPPPGSNLFLKLTAAVEGLFALQGGSDPEGLKGFTSLQAPVLLLPYLRQVVTDLTAQSRIGPLVMPPINMAEVTKAMRQAPSASQRMPSEAR